MSRLPITACLSCFAANFALAQTPFAPQGEIGINYSYNQLSTFGPDTSHENGGSVYGEYLFSPVPSRTLHAMGSLGLVAEFSGSGAPSGQFYSLLIGPRFNFEWRKSHLNAWGEFNGSVSHASAYAGALAGQISRTGFFFGAADGLDLVLKQRYLVHLFQIEFAAVKLPAVPPGSGSGGGDLRVSAGFGYRFGER